MKPVLTVEERRLQRNAAGIPPAMDSLWPRNYRADVLLLTSTVGELRASRNEIAEQANAVAWGWLQSWRDDGHTGCPDCSSTENDRHDDNCGLNQLLTLTAPFAQE
jgi:hypothetical protein